MAYGGSKDLATRMESDKVLRDKAFEIASNPKYALLVYKSFDKKSVGSEVNSMPNYQLANELHKQIIKKFKRRKVYSSFRDNIWGADLADIQSLSKCNKGIKYLLCVLSIYF